MAGKGHILRKGADLAAFGAGYEGIAWQPRPPVAHVVFFDSVPDHRWRLMAEVLRFSLGRFGVECVLHELAEEVGSVCKARNNVAKLAKWAEIVEAAKGPVLLLDADMYCRRSLTGVFDEVPHVGITFRDPQYLSVGPLNGGVVFVRPTAWAKEFFRNWVKMDQRILRDQGFAVKWRRIYSGQNQAALGAMIESGMADEITRLECQEVNLCEPWARLDDARLVHVKGRMVSMIWGGVPFGTAEETAVRDEWRAVAAEAKIF